MAALSIEKLAQVVGMTNEQMLAELNAAGVSVSSSQDSITEADQQTLLMYLSQSKSKQQDSKQKKSTLTLKSSSQPQKEAPATTTKKTLSLSPNKGETIIKTRGKRLLVKKSDLLSKPKAPPVEPAPEKPVQPEQEVESLEKETPEASVTPKMPVEDTGAPVVAQFAELNPPPPPSEKPGRATRKRPQSVRNVVVKKRRHGGSIDLKKVGERRATPSSVEHAFAKPTAFVARDITLHQNGTITVSELAQKMSVKAAEVIKTLMGLGMIATINQVIDQETAAIVVEEMGHRVKLVDSSPLETELALDVDVQGEHKPRAPVVTIMGHVDHGKTTLLDYMRQSKVTQGEAGGITQHIGAYEVSTPKGRLVFIDTPGHEAFTAMRARGAKSTDIVVLVVAADDGVMPQTREAIQHAKLAGVPIVVAINKMDKPEADVERIKSELAQNEVVPEDWGGDAMCQPISAKTGEGVEALLDALLLQAELMELTAVVEGPARGVVLESRLDKGRGVVITLLVQQGTLKKGDILLAGCEYGRLRHLRDSAGHQIEQAGPSVPVEVLGLSGVPEAGNEVFVLDSESKARELATLRAKKRREEKLAHTHVVKLEDILNKVRAGEQTTLNIILKADTQGSLGAIKESLKKLDELQDEVRVVIVAHNVGGITESDINLALASQAIVVGFNVRADAIARRLAEREAIEINYYSIIYDLVNAIKDVINGLLMPEIEERITGLAQVREVFRSSKLGSIAGCKVTEGTMKRQLPIRVLRDNVVIYEGELESLRRFKEIVNEVREGMECGIGVKDYNDVKVGDQIETYEVVEKKREL